MLPGDGPAPDRPDTAGALATRRIEARLAASLERVARAEQATVFMALLAAFQLLLGRWAGSEDIVVGTPIAGRTCAETESLVGFFVNTLALRTSLTGNPSFRELLARVRESTLGGYVHQNLPFEELVDALAPERRLHHTPIVQVMINQTDTLPIATEFAELRLEFLDPIEPASKFPLTLYVGEDGDGEIVLQAVYQTALFSPERIECLLEQISTLLEQITVAPERPIGEYTLLTPRAASILPNPAVPLPTRQYRTTGEMVEDWVVMTPSAIAVEQGAERLTYAELGQSAAEVRAELVRQGLQPGDVVAISGPRCPGLIAAMLGVISSQGVMLTLDSNLPSERQELMVHESGAAYAVVVDAEPAATCLPTPVGVDSRTGALTDPPHADVPRAVSKHVPPPAGAGGDRPAYVFFTSGTTGTPKAVLGRQNGLAHFLDWQRSTFRIAPHDRCAQLTGVSFDVVMRDVFLALVSGATLCLPANADALDPDRTLAWLSDTRATSVHTVPSLVRAWLAGRQPAGGVPSLRRTFFAGEPLTGELVRRWREACPNTEVINLYGPTETTLAKCSYVVPVDCTSGTQPVGGAQPGAQALVLSPTWAGVGSPRRARSSFARPSERSDTSTRRTPSGGLFPIPTPGIRPISSIAPATAVATAPTVYWRSSAVLMAR